MGPWGTLEWEELATGTWVRRPDPTLGIKTPFLAFVWKKQPKKGEAFDKPTFHWQVAAKWATCNGYEHGRELADAELRRRDEEDKKALED